MKRLLSFVLGLTIITSLLMGVLLLLGRAEPIPQRIEWLHLTDCALPCWSGVTPGVSSLSDAVAHIDAALPDFDRQPIIDGRFLFWVKRSDMNPILHRVEVEGENGTVVWMSIVMGQPNDDMPTLSEMLALYGSPTCAIVDDQTGFGDMFYENGAPHFALQFTIFPFSLTTPVNSLVFGVPNNAGCLNNPTLSWQEFRRLKPEFLSIANVG
jgi:hypothetical protein